MSFLLYGPTWDLFSKFCLFNSLRLTYASLDTAVFSTHSYYLEPSVDDLTFRPKNLIAQPYLQAVPDDFL